MVIVISPGGVNPAPTKAKGLHRVGGVGADDADVVVEEGGVDGGDFDLGHVAGDAVGFGLRADFWRRVLMRFVERHRGGLLDKMGGGIFWRGGGGIFCSCSSRCG
jgi:hypothetical protein